MRAEVTRIVRQADRPANFGVLIGGGRDGQ